MTNYRILFVLLCVLLFSASPVFAVMYGSNYVVTSDVIASGGGLASSTQYINQGIVGQGSPVGTMTSSGGNYLVASGFIYTIFPSVPSDTDVDGDGILASQDNCPDTANPDQNDADVDGVGDACDMSDTDGDGVADNSDSFPTDPAASVDSDGDGYPDAWNEGMSANDSTTGLELDAFPLNADEVADTDGDGIGDNADLDDDNDGQTDARELSCGADPKDPVSFCSASLPWLMLLLEDE